MAQIKTADYKLKLLEERISPNPLRRKHDDPGFPRLNPPHSTESRDSRPSPTPSSTETKEISTCQGLNADKSASQEDWLVSSSQSSTSIKHYCSLTKRSRKKERRLTRVPKKDQPTIEEKTDSNSSSDIQSYFKPFSMGERRWRSTISPLTPIQVEGLKADKWHTSDKENNNGGQVDKRDKELEVLHSNMRDLTKEIQEYKFYMAQKERIISQLQEQSARSKDFICKLLIQNERKEREEAKEWVDKQTAKLGKLVIHRQGTSMKEYWEPGSSFRKVQAKLEALRERREAVEHERASVKADSLNKKEELFKSLLERENNAIFERRIRALSEEEEALQAEMKELENKRIILLQEIRRQREESVSRFCNFTVLNQQYLLVKLIGKGGFSEVFKALDLLELRWVACKIHQLNNCWTEEQKSNYMRHTTREYEIHKTLNHPRVVQLFDVFEINSDSFCTVLEYCDGSDLDTYLKSKGSLSEDEAKLIISQVLNGLLYLNEQPRKIIHYDLKPANILFRDGEVRIADFGLCKVIENMENSVETTELTSQGAGTYWYLPPECFVTGDISPRISPKVDIWSVGVIFYQMLFGKKPFGHGLSQQRLLQDGIVHGSPLMFPSFPVVSEEAKEFIRGCLSCSVETRFDVHQAAFHRYLKNNLIS
eukprot:jgi/Galph1/4885/GphlegSOOS_G3578.1